MMGNGPIIHFHRSCLLNVACLALACICLCLLVQQSIVLKHVQSEVRELRLWTGLDCGETDDAISHCGVGE